jgi:hypothetical protein
MGYVVAILLLIGGAIGSVAYTGTPGYNGPGCGPIDVFTITFSVDVDCRTMQFGELLATFACFLLAIFAMFNARKRGEHRRW